jgi:glycosyltransferase involved in cell wall biosynthesis
MLGLAHGYSLSGSGSNFWTGAVARALARQGERFHLFSQESDPARFDFIAAAYEYGPDGERETLFERELDGGAAVLHRARLDIVPTFVRPVNWPRARWIPDMTEEDVEAYVEHNARVFARVAEEEGLEALAVNHTILLSVAAQRARERTGLRYAVTPHGSALEYVIRKDEGMRELAASALEAADGIFVLNEELRERLRELFPDVPGRDPKMRPLRVGVDTELFRPAGDAAPRDHPLIAYVGRLLAAKGPASFIMALPPILAGAPGARAVLMGGGPIQDALEALVAALAAGDRQTVKRLLVEGDTPEQEEGPGEPFLPALRYWERLEATGEVDDYLAAAARHELTDRVEFTGRLPQEAVAERLGSADVLVVPSVVAEVGPMVVPEAAAAGVFPMGTDFGGMHHTLNALAQELSEGLRPHMRLRRDPDHTVSDIVHNVSAVLATEVPSERLRQAAIREFGWERIAAELAEGLRALD